MQACRGGVYGQSRSPCRSDLCIGEKKAGTCANTSPLSLVARPAGRTHLRGGREVSDQALVHHRVGHFQEAGDVGADHIVPRHVVFLSRLEAGLWMLLHDLVQAVVDFFFRPGQAHAVLAHFEPRCRDASGIRRFSRRVEDLCIEEHLHAVEVLSACWRLRRRTCSRSSRARVHRRHSVHSVWRREGRRPP